MWTMIQGLIVLLMEMVQSASSLPGFHTAGTEFVFGCPHVADGKYFEANIHVTTEMHRVAYDLWEPSEYNRGDYPAANRKRHNLNPYESLSHRLNSKCKVMQKDIYKSYRVNATSPVYIILALENRVKCHISMFKLIPKESCFNKYYISTLKGHAFMSVHAFNFSNIRAAFPKSIVLYGMVSCKANNDFCRPKTILNFHLNPHEFWYLVSSDSYTDFQNAEIESDSPVFVIAGNTKVRNVDTWPDSWYSIASTMKPTVAWGKVYVVPHFFGESKPSKMILIINAETFPFRFFLTDVLTSNVTVDTAQYVHDGIKRPVVVSAETAFGLHAVMPTSIDYGGTRLDAALINVIPVEQWINGFVRLWNAIDKRPKSESTFLILSTADPKDVFFRNYDQQPKWGILENFNNTIFHYTTVALKGKNTFIFLRNATGKLMLYVRHQPKGYCSSAFPYDFYQGEIFQANCTKVLPVVSDGVDNDCDGVIDEEVQNDKDDDGDGEVDEDIVETYVDGLWTSWESACHIMCGTHKIKQFIRECANPVPSRFGFSCIGNTTSETNEHPTSCQGSELIQICSCRRNCSACRNDKAVCDACRPGYYQSPYCLKPCPRGWTGATCSRGPRTITDFLPDEEQTTLRTPRRHAQGNTSTLLLMIAGVVLFAAFCFISIWKQKSKSKSESQNAAGNQETQSIKESSVDLPHSGSKRWSSSLLPKRLTSGSLSQS